MPYLHNPRSQATSSSLAHVTCTSLNQVNKFLRSNKTFYPKYKYPISFLDLPSLHISTTPVPSTTPNNTHCIYLPAHTMDFVKKAMGGSESNTQQVSGGNNQQTSSSGGGFLGGIGDKLNSAAGGGRESEKNEDYLDKGTISDLSPHTSSRYALRYMYGERI